MKISCNILKKYIKNSSDIDFYKIWDTFTIRTAEVEGVEVKGTDVKGVVVAEIIECNSHPKKDKYHILKANNGKNIVNILCGAPNVRKGIKVPLVNVGGMVSGFTIEEKEIAGVLSEGMLCSERELGISSDHEGIMILPDNYEVGKDIKEYFPIDDIIVEIDNKSLTNRPDLWGHYGIAREIAAITKHKLLPLDLYDVPNNKRDLDIKVKDKDLCPRYTSLKIDNINAKVTPVDIKIALFYTGLRSISLLVDLTNYIMIELGQPMHAFDSSKVKNIEVGLGANNTTFTTLDGVERKITNGTLMIKKNNEYFAIAGIMGGLDSEVTEETSSIILESANFEPTTIRKSATRLGLRTDASARYEKSLDPNMTIIGCKRFVKLLKDVDNNIDFGSNITDVYPEELKPNKVILRKDKLNKYMGIELKDNVVEDILESLDFKVETTKDNYKVIAPTYRSTKDISIDVDIIEEISRIYGYENFEKYPLKLDLNINSNNETYGFEYDIKKYLSNKFNLNEVHSYLWYKTSFLNKLNISKDNVYLESKKEDNILRDDLAIVLLEITKNNLKNYDKVNIFELGTTIENNENVRHLCVLLTDNIEKTEDTYIFGKKIVFDLIKSKLNKKVLFNLTSNYDLYSHVLELDVEGTTIGNIKTFKNNISKKNSTVVIDINFDVFVTLNKKLIEFSEPNKYPTVELDYSIISSKDIKYKEIEKVLDKFDSSVVINRILKEKYEKNSKTTYTIKYTLGNSEKTFTQEELDDFKNKFIKHIRENDFEIVE